MKGRVQCSDPMWISKSIITSIKCFEKEYYEFLKNLCYKSNEEDSGFLRVNRLYYRDHKSC